ncbi:MAG: shikimate 5-dehydrogenase [Rhodobacter sp. CACIA14H1]|nr:MAG: shikimate 5-dehydrogenase [Rhodobacter sp. CACIA14H1]
MQITGQTDLFYIVGTPVRHFRAPILFNEHFAAMGHDFCCGGLNVLPEDLAAALALVRRVDNIRGLCITAPHKIAAAALVDRRTDAAEQAGSVNFVRREGDGTLTGHNLDGLGFLRGLRASGFEPEGRRVLLLGAGGVGRAIAFALAGAGVGGLVLSNRDAGKAAALSQEVTRATGLAVGTVGAVGTDALAGFDLVANATSVGMGGSEGMPVALDGIAPEAMVADVVISPQDTPFIAAARAAGCRVMPGSAMLRPQIELSEGFLYGGAED